LKNTNTFTTGSVSKQLLIMTFASWVAMVASMLLSLVDMFFLSRLDDINVLAAMGFAASISLLTASIGIGFSVSTSVLVSQKLTKDGALPAHKLFTAISWIGLVFSSLLALALLFGLPWILILLGAETEVFDYASRYLHLTLLASPLGVLTMIFASGLRAAAMAKASMWISLVATIINIILDPILIEYLAWGIEGAAWATIIARVISFLVGIWYFGLQLKWFKPITLNFVITELPSIRKITMPVLISNWFTPIGSIIVVLIVSSYGSEAMAGLAVVGSLSPILFSVFFSITGAAGPMVGQNIGAKQPQRIAKIYRSGLAFIALYTLCIWLVALPAIDLIIQFYGLSGLPASLIEIYCSIQIPLSMGLGAIALSNGIFNNLGRPRWSMWLSLARATLGTLLLCYLGNLLFGLYGTVIGASLTFFVFGLIAICLANRLFKTHYPQISLLRL